MTWSYDRGVLNRPAGVTDDELVEVLHRAWALGARDLRYAPVGFGSHHWLTTDHFVTVDEVRDATALDAALRTATALRHDAGLEFVVAPLPTDDGALLVPLGDEWLVHVYERLIVVDDTQFGPHEDPEVVEMVRAIHDATPIASTYANREDFSIWERDELEEALADLDDPWCTGPYGERARRLLAEHATDLQRLLDVHDRLVGEVHTDGWVVTHGEPHRGNVFRSTRGWVVVDWDTVLLAPAERDLWDLPVDGRAVLDELYRLRWDLMEVAVYIAGFYDDHPGDENDAQSWHGLTTYLDPRRRWPHLL